MKISVEAVYEHGVFRPCNSVSLQNGRLVTLEIELIPPARPENASDQSESSPHETPGEPSPH